MSSRGASRRCSATFSVSVALGQLRGVRVYVTGFVARPGAYTREQPVHGDAGAASCRRPGRCGQLSQHRACAAATSRAVTLDLYDMLLRGDARSDRLLQADDVIHVGPVGPLVGLIGSVNKPGRVRAEAGRHSSRRARDGRRLQRRADTTRLSVERLDDARRVRGSPCSSCRNRPASACAAATCCAPSARCRCALPQQRQNKRVRVEGEVLRPGEYVLPPETTIDDALRAAGGLTAAAYVYGTEFTRESVRSSSSRTTIARCATSRPTWRAPTPRSASPAPTTPPRRQRAAAGHQRVLVERLRTHPPDRAHRAADRTRRAPRCPPLALEDGDRCTCRPAHVGGRVRQRLQRRQLPACVKPLAATIICGWPAARRAAPTPQPVRDPRQWHRGQQAQEPAGSAAAMRTSTGFPRRARRHHLRARGPGQDHVRAGRQGLDADPVPVRSWRRRHSATAGLTCRQAPK